MDDVFVSLLNFCIGFVAGAILEYLAINTYLLIDPEKTSKLYIVIIAVIELLLLFKVAKVLDTKEAWFGLVTSQLFIFNHVIRKFYNPLRNLE